jgi:hypothetical protein
MARRTLPLALVALALAGCSGAQPRKPQPTKAAFAAAADRICARATTRPGRLARLRALRPPAGGEDLYPHWLTAERDALEAAEMLAHPPKKADVDPRVLLAIAEGKIAGYARRLGAERCALSAMGTIPP